MEQNSMTARVSAFARAYHARREGVRIFDDSVADRLLTEEEKAEVAAAMAGGVSFFHPAFQGTEEEALDWVVEHQLAPTPLGRAAFAEEALERAVSLGAQQYLILGAGYDSFALRRPDWGKSLAVFEVDHPAMSAGKKRRVERLAGEAPARLWFLPADLAASGLEERVNGCPAFSTAKRTFCSALGLAYYLSRPAFQTMLEQLTRLLSTGSSLVFDYPSPAEKSGARGSRERAMATEAGEPMLGGYTYRELEELLDRHDFLIYEHLGPEEITARFFAAYNLAEPDHAMTAPDHVSYCLAVRR